MPAFFVEEFTLEDAPTIAKLLQRVWSSVTEYPPTWRARRTLSAEEIRQEMREGGFRYFGIRAESRIVGVYKLSVGNEILGEQQTVDPAYRKKGFASLMYEQFLELGRQLGKPNCVNLLVTNKKMIAFVKRLGFRPSGDSYEQYPGMFVQKFYFYHETE